MHLFFLKEAWRSIRHHRGLAWTSILSLTAALTLSGLFLLLAHNANATLRLIGDRREMVVYLKDEVSEAQRTQLVDRLQQLYGAVTYVSKDEAWREFEQQVGDAALLEAVGTNPLPASLRVRLRPELLTYAGMDSSARQVGAFPEVEDVRFGGEWVRRLDQVTDTLKLVAVAVGIVVALAIVFMVHNTIRLSVLARRPQVEIMSRLGASDRFIATPYVIEAMLQGIAAALLSLGVLYALQQAMTHRVVAVQFLPPLGMLLFVAAALVLAWIAAIVALSRVLRAVGP